MNSLIYVIIGMLIMVIILPIIEQLSSFISSALELMRTKINIKILELNNKMSILNANVDAEIKSIKNKSIMKESVNSSIGFIYPEVDDKKECE